MTTTVTKKTLILTTSESDGNFKYVDGKGYVYINSVILRSPSPDNVTIPSINGKYIIYFSADVTESSNVITIMTSENSYEYKPKDNNPTELSKKMNYKRLDMMLDDDTSYSLLHVNPKLTGNVKVVVDSESNLYLDTFKVSLGLSQNKYRHIPINPSEYYGRTLMTKMKSMPSDDFYKIEETCYDLFATANDFDEQYYDKYNYGVRTNSDKMYNENYALLAPLCIRKTLPDFFLVFKINNYESTFEEKNIILKNRTNFINLDYCQLIKSFDLREGTNLGTYIRKILENNKTSVGDVYTGYDYNHFNIFNGISLDRGVVTNIYEETTPERNINNQVAMNDWYTLGFQRNRIVSKDIINFEFMFDDTSEKLFSLPTYFGVYVRLNGENETFTCIDVNQNGAVFDSSIHGTNMGSVFDPKSYKTAIYGISTPDSFVRLSNNIKDDQEVKKHNLQTYKNIITVDTYNVSDYNGVNYTNGDWGFASNKLNDVLDPGEHYRVIDQQNKKIYEVIASNFFDDVELSNISYTEENINGSTYEIFRVSILNTEYRSNISDDDKPELIKSQIKLITKAFTKFNCENMKVFNDGDNSFSIAYSINHSIGKSNIYFEKISSICGFNQSNDNEIKAIDDEGNLIFNDKSSYIFGYDRIKPMILDPKEEGFESSNARLYYPVGFESLGTRVGYCVSFIKIVYTNNGESMVLVNEDVQKKLSNYKTVLYTTSLGVGENKIFTKNITLSYQQLSSGIISTIETEPMYNVIGFGSRKTYLTKFEKTPFIKNNQKLQLFQNYPMNAGLCSIFPLKDYNFEVLDKNSVFFIKNENDTSESTRIEGSDSEYSDTSTNAYGDQIIINSEEFIADYCDKFETYNIDTTGKGYMALQTEDDLGDFLSNMQSKGHNKFDISLLSPYCCKWRLLGTDMTGNRMRVMYNLQDINYKVYTYDENTWTKGSLTADGTVIQIHLSDISTSPFIDISDMKDISLDFTDKLLYYYIGYYLSEIERPTKLKLHWNKKIDQDLIKTSNYIRISIRPDYLKSITVSKAYGDKPYLLRGRTSYWIPESDETHIGFLSYDFDSHQTDEENREKEYTKYIDNLYDEDETRSYNSYIYNQNGSIDDILYRDKNYINKFSKIYNYGDNSIEFVSCGVKVRMKSTDKSMINLSRYVGYSAILLAMSGNNANQPGTYELFVDEIKEQVALVVYNGISSNNNRINYSNEDVGTYRVKHSVKISNSEYKNGIGVIIKDDGYLIDCSTGLIGSTLTLISKPTKEYNSEEITDAKQIIISGQITNIENGYITLDKNNLYKAIDSSVYPILDQLDIDVLISGNNNVDAYIETIEPSVVSTHSLTLENLKNLTSSYAIAIKTANGTKKYNDISSILSIDLVDPFELQRENTSYDIVTTGYTHPSYAVPVMNDIFDFDFNVDNSISDTFETWFEGCNILINDVNTIKQTWLKKVIDIDNVMKRERIDSSTTTTNQNIRYTATQIPISGDEYINLPVRGDSYKEYNITDGSVFKIEDTIYGESVSTSITKYPIKPQELRVKPDNTYKKWQSTQHTIVYPDNFNYDESDIKYDELNGCYYGDFVLDKIGGGESERLNKNEKMCYYTNILSGVVDSSSNMDLLNTLSEYNDKIFGKINDDDSGYALYFDGLIDAANNEKILRLRYENDEESFPSTQVSSMYFVNNQNDTSVGALRYNKSYTIDYNKTRLSNLLYFTINDVIPITETKYKSATIKLISYDINSKLTRKSGYLQNINNENELIYYSNAIDTTNSDPPIIIYSKIINQSSSVTLFRHNDPLIGYWYTNMCRLFSEYDTYLSYYGAFSGYEKNNYIASRGICLKTKYSSENTNMNTFVISNWSESIIDLDKKSISLNVTASTVNFINDSSINGYSNSWNKNQEFINSVGMSYEKYKSKYIENTILKLIDINNNTKFILYVDNSVDVFIFNNQKPLDTTNYEVVENLKNTLVQSENRYYMNIEDLEPHSYYAEMIINL